MSDFTNRKAAQALRVLAREIETGEHKIEGIMMVIASHTLTRLITIGDETAAGCALGYVLPKYPEFVALAAPSPSAALN
jgi:hypothetical protein